MAPRRANPRQQVETTQPRNPSLHQAQPSDYESEAQYKPVSLPAKTNTELNLSVLQRYVPSVTGIPSLASSVDVYTYVPALETWERTEINGTLFVCELHKGSDYGLVVLNKKGLENLVVHGVDVLEVEITPKLLIIRYRVQDSHKAIGYFIQDVPVGTRVAMSNYIQGLWEKTLSDGHEPILEPDFAENGVFPQGAEYVPGQRLSISDLFGYKVST